MKTLEQINYWCEMITTKNIVEVGAILLILIPTVIFIIRERQGIKH